MDNCWDYHDGEASVRMGKALRDGYRQKVFLMTKIDGRTKASAAEADRRVAAAAADRRDRPACSTTRSSAWRTRTGSSPRDGPLEALLEAKKAGKIRYIGFTGHKDPLVHLRMLEVADAARLPLRLRCRCRSTSWTRTSAASSSRSCRVLVKQGHRRAGHEVDGGRPASSKSKTVTPIECLHYALNLPTSVVITGCDSMERLDQALEVGAHLQAADGRRRWPRCSPRRARPR